MSASMRPIREFRGPDTSIFLSHEKVLQLLRTIAENAKLEYGDRGDQGCTIFWVDQGGKFLEYLKSAASLDFKGLIPFDDLREKADLKSLADNIYIMISTKKWNDFIDNGVFSLKID